MKIENIGDILDLLKEKDIINDYNYLGSNIFSINYGDCYIGLNSEGCLEKNCKMIEDYAEIIEQEEKLTNSKKKFKEKYAKDYK